MELTIQRTGYTVESLHERTQTLVPMRENVTLGEAKETARLLRRCGLVPEVWCEATGNRVFGF